MKNQIQRNGRHIGEVDDLTTNRSTGFMPSPNSAFRPHSH
jgi:hypothetical protein